MKVPERRSGLERLLSIFAEVRGGEGVTTLLLTFNVFLLLSAYYIIKPVREALILSEGTAELKSYLSAGQAVLLLAVVPVYAWLAGRLPRRTLINTVTLFFAACLVAFYFLGRLGVPLAVVFYLWVGIFNLMVVAQFWSFANDLYTPEEGGRLFAIVAFGASAGAVVGATTVGRIIEWVGIYTPLLLSALVLVIALVVTNLVDRREKGRAVGRDSSGGAEKPLPKGDAFKLVLRSPYLLLIAFMILFLNWVNTNGEYILSRVVSNAAVHAVESGAAGGLSVGEYVGKFYSDFFSVVNVAGLLIQLFVVSRILKYFGVRIALLILPVIALAGYGLLAAFPVLAVVRWAKTAENATDYSLQNTLRGVLFLPTTREEKYKAKQAIDTFFVRTGDLLQAATVFVGVQFLALSTRGFALFNMALVVVWIVLAVLIGRRFVALSKQVPEKTEESV